MQIPSASQQPCPGGMSARMLTKPFLSPAADADELRWGRPLPSRNPANSAAHLVLKGLVLSMSGWVIRT